MKNRILAILLALVLTLSLLPAGPTARAADDRPYNESATDSTVTVTFDLNGYGSDGPAPQSVTAGTPVADPGYSAVIDGMLFDGWYTEPECENPYDFAAPVSADLKLYASFVRCHTIHFDPNGATEGEMPDVIVKHGDTFVLPECEFLCRGKNPGTWNVSGHSQQLKPGSPIVIFQDHTIRAVWETAVIRFDSNGGSGQMRRRLCPESGYYTLPACGFTPPEGKRFSAWNLGPAGESVPIYGDQTLYALWEDAVYTLSFSAGGGSGEMLDATAQGGVCELPECGFTAPAGMAFQGWSIPAATGQIHTFYPGYPVKLNSDAVATAQWVSAGTDSYTVSFEPSMDVAGYMPPIHAQAGTEITVPECLYIPPNHETLISYAALCNSDYSSLGLFDSGDELTVNDNITFSALWALYYSKITFDSRGHGTAPEPLIVYPGERPVRPEDPQAPGWTFEGWYSGYIEYDFDRPLYHSEDLTLSAHWTMTNFSVFLEHGEHGTASVSSRSTYMDDEITVTAKPDTGYAVDKIIYTPAGGEEVDLTDAYDPATGTASFIMPPANVAVAVFFKPIEPVLYPVSLEIVGDGTAALSKNSAEAWDRVTVQAAPAEGWSLERVLLIAQDGSQREITERMGFNMPEGPATVRVEFVSDPHEIILDVGPGGTAGLSVEPAASQSCHSERSEKSVPPSLSADAEPGQTAQKPSDSAAAAHSVRQNPALRQLGKTPSDELPLNEAAADTLRADGAHCAPLQAKAPAVAGTGDTVTVTAVPERGYQLKSIRVLPASGTPEEITESGNFTMPACDVTVEVRFEAAPAYTLTLETEGEGVAVLSAETAFEGDWITVAATPAEGWRVNRLSCSQDGVLWLDFSYGRGFTMPAANVTVRVRFTKIVNGWPVNLELGEGGTATLSADYAVVGDTVTVSPEADAARGWELDKITWRTMEGEETDITEAKEFTMPAEAVTVKVSFRRINPFVDNIQGKYYYNNVLWAYWHDPRVTSGTDDTHFSPNKDCTREQIVTFLYAAYGKPGHEETESTFSDVTPKKYYYHAVMWAVEKGVTGGVEDGTKFGVGRPCTREQVVTFLWKAAGAPEPAGADCPFTDVKPGKYYYKAVLWAVENGVTGGMSATSFGVGKTCTRAQVVTFLYKAVGQNE